MYEALIYGNINQYSARDFILGISAAAPSDIKVRVNTDGGEVRYGWGMLAKVAEITGKKTFCNDGEANSMGAMAFCYADEAESIREGTFLFHRAGYPDWIENNPDYFTEDDRAYLVAMNANLRKAFEAKIDVEKFRLMKKVSVDQLFSMAGRPEVVLTAEEAKEVGLIQKITDIDMTAKAEISKRKVAYAQKYSGYKAAAETTPIKKQMTRDQLKAEHPAVYAEIFSAGATDEHDRVLSCLEFHEIDAKGAIEAVKSKKPLTAQAMAAFAVKGIAAAGKANLASDSAPATATTEVTDGDKKPTAAEALIAAASKHSTYFKPAAK